MYKLFLFGLCAKHSTHSLLIENIKPPTCANCVHFMKYSYIHSSRGDVNQELGKCKLFGEKNLVSGIITYDYASVCRISEKKCGIEGKHYEEKGRKKGQEEDLLSFVKNLFKDW